MKYIGARYMPKFMGTHDATQAYEALSIVDNGSGTTYVANMPVPAGTPLSDTDYWAVYGASSGAIINLQNQINDINTHMANLRIVNPIDHGAAGDGLTDDTAALNALIKDNVKIDLAGRSYYITGALDLTEHENVEICNGTIIRDVNQLFNTFYGWRSKNIYIHDITSDAQGNNPGTTYTWPDDEQAFALIARSSNVYIYRNLISNYKYGVTALDADQDQLIKPDPNRAFSAQVNFNIFKSCGSCVDMYGKNFEIAFNTFIHIDGDGCVIVEPVGSNTIDPDDPFGDSDFNVASYGSSIHNNYADDVLTFVSGRRSAYGIFVENNIVSDFRSAVNGSYAVGWKIANNLFSNQKGKVWDASLTRAYQYPHAIELANAEITNNSFVNLCAGILIRGNSGSTPPSAKCNAIIAGNFFDNLLVDAIAQYVTGNNPEEITIIDDNYIGNIDTTGDATKDYFYRPISNESGLMIIKNNVINTTRKPIRGFGGPECTVYKNLIATTQTDPLTPISGLVEMSNI